MGLPKWKLKDNKDLQLVIKRKEKARKTRILENTIEELFDWRDTKPGQPKWEDMDPLLPLTTTAGYVQIDPRVDWEWNKNNPHVQFNKKNSRILEHRYVWEKANNEYLLPVNHVHHKNGKRNDNNASNLERWSGNHLHGVREEDMLEWSMNRISAERAKSFYHTNGIPAYLISRISSHYFHTEKSKVIIKDTLMEFFNDLTEDEAYKLANKLQEEQQELKDKYKYDTHEVTGESSPKNKYNEKIIQYKKLNK
jgi:hypothetical protein